MSCKESIIIQQQDFNHMPSSQLAHVSTMLFKLTWQFGLLQHELILTHILEKNSNSFIKAENAGNCDSTARVALFCQMTIITSLQR